MTNPLISMVSSSPSVSLVREIFKSERKRTAFGQFFFHALCKGWPAFVLLDFVGSPPDSHSLRFIAKPVSEIGMGDGDQHLRPLPCVPAGQVDGTVFCHDEMGLTPRRGDDITFREEGPDG